MKFPLVAPCATCFRQNWLGWNGICPACGRGPDSFCCHFCGQSLRHRSIYCDSCFEKLLRDIRFVQASRRMTTQQADGFEVILDEEFGPQHK